MLVDDDLVIAELRDFMYENGVLPLPEQQFPDPHALEQILWRIRAEDRRHQAGRSAWLASVAAVLTAVAVTVSVIFGSAPATALPTPLTYSLVSPRDIQQALPAYAALLETARIVAEVPLYADGDVHYVARAGWLATIRYDGDVAEQYLVPTITQSWLAPDGSARMNQSRGAPLEPDGSLRLSADSSERELLSTDFVPAGTFDPDFPSSLPRDPAALREALLEPWALPDDTSTSMSAYVLATEVAELHGMHVIPNDLTAALWEVLATELDVRNLGQATARDGRFVHGFAVIADRPGLPSVALVLHASVETGQFVGTERVMLVDPEHGVTEPTLMGFEVWLHQGMIRSVGGEAS